MDEVVDQLFEDLVLEEILDVGRELRWGLLTAVLEPIPPELRINDTPGVDIFGQVLSKKPNFECECPKCNRMLAAARFAPHLEKCMGMGRNSSRIASRRLAASGTNSSSSSAVGSSDAVVKSSSAASNGSSSGASVTQVLVFSFKIVIHYQRMD